MRKEFVIKNIDSTINIIKEPIHGEKFYTRKMLQELIKRVDEICEKMEIDENTSPENKISIINNYIKQNVSIRQSYFDAFCERTNKFDKSELIYRTAYGALVRGESMCAGFIEALRILLAQYNIKTYTILSKLPGKNKRLLHYVGIAEFQKDGKFEYKLLDPERQANCEKRGMDYQKYKDNMIYILTDPIFTNDVVGNDGVGIEAEEYLKHKDIFKIQGVDRLDELVGKINKKSVNKEK